MAEVKRVTEPQLADILKGFRLAVRTEGGELVNGEIHVPDNVALHVFRSVGAAREDEQGSRHPTGPRTEDADLCARCGSQFMPGQVCDSCREIDADAEMGPMAAIVAAMSELPDAFDSTTSGAPWRVLSYVAARYGFVLATED